MAPATDTTELTSKERLRLNEFLAALNLFVELDEHIPLHMLRAFVAAALHEGAGSVEVGRLIGQGNPELGMESGPVARTLGAWGRYDRYGKLSFDFIEGRADEGPNADRRAKKQYLTKGGRGFLKKLLTALHA